MFFATILRILGLVGTVVGAVSPGSGAATKASEIAQIISNFLSPLATKLVPITDLHSAYADLQAIVGKFATAGDLFPPGIQAALTKIEALFGGLLGLKPLDNAENALTDLTLALNALHAAGIVTFTPAEQSIIGYVEGIPALVQRLNTGSAVKLPFKVNVPGVAAKVDTYLSAEGSTDIPPSYAA